ncbi:MAG: ATP-dependent DNA ligase [Deltaproteobacteria bacterium]|nr:MAG: ATP-dependent DNA ligase [Deltaproteobacteria bacterium]
MRKKLPEYEARRDFAVTPEPPPGAVVPHPEPTFVVHKHDATRLHYDVRLEMDGALASWSVPKGPSYDPAIKRLAIQTEDHPLEYGSFEGRIPDGEYGAGDSLIWDNGTCDSVPPGKLSEQRKKGHIVVEFHGKKLQGQWHLVRTHGGAPGKAQWLMFKAKDGKENPAYDVVAERPESVVSGRVATRGPERSGKLRAPRAAPDAILRGYLPPMLATLVAIGRSARCRTAGWRCGRATLSI